MAVDRLHADVDTLRDYATNAKTRADDIAAVRAAVADVHLGAEMLGIVNTWFVNDVVGEKGTVVTALAGVHAAVSRDSAAAAAAATDLAATEEKNTSKFRTTERP
jgi:hypothetical protein